MRVPSGDQAGSASDPACVTIECRPAPVASITHRSRPLVALARSKTMCAPSGDQFGCLAETPGGVSATAPLPSAAIVHSVYSPPSVCRTNAMRVPSGEYADLFGVRVGRQRRRGGSVGGDAHDVVVAGRAGHDGEASVEPGGRARPRRSRQHEHRRNHGDRRSRARSQAMDHRGEYDRNVVTMPLDSGGTSRTIQRREPRSFTSGEKV